ncbi:MAG: Methyl-accepting chemotaxis protein 4 [Chlamydiae bacterium]|nr:Methyl-accepting chemotaxis protein 4 [Chlamydiota bacterium]
MKRKIRGPFPWLMIHLSSFYRHLVTVLIFGLGYLVLCWVLFSQISHDLTSIQMKKMGLRYQEHLRELLLNINTHKYVVQRFYEGNYGLKNQILNIQVSANENLRSIEKENILLEEIIENRSDSGLAPIEKEYRPDQINQEWKEIRKSVFNIDIPTSHELHDDLLIQIQGLITYSANLSELTQDTSLIVYELVEGTSGLLPEIQKTIGQIMNLSQKVISLKEMSVNERDELVGSLAVLEKYIQAGEKMIPTAITLLADQPDLREQITQAFGAYSQALDEFMEEVRKDLAASNLNSLSLSRFENIGIRAMNETFVLWDAGAKVLLELLDEREDAIRIHRLVIIGVTLAIVLFGFFLGAYFVLESQKALRALKETSIKISRGDLSARVPIRHRDEMGKVCVVFNHMAATLERMMIQFRLLINGTQRLASGDFTARLEVDSSSDDEIRAVGVSFNRMAESFEEVVSRLHRLVIDLTSSATQISAASKQHEATLSEQGVTTKQISVTATEISATAKDFALTISEVGGVADETARLVRMGQSSLVRMEKAMNKMEDAAANITSRLADLNEKAGNITSVITAISDVSAQTNLLSLNAAIEAEKAGQAGRSFSVIAREIRDLSSQTAMSTLDIEKIVTEIMDAVKSSVMGVDDFTQEIRDGANQVNEVSEQLSKIMEQVKSLVERFDSVDHGMKNQSEAAEQINKALIDLSEMANETNISMRHFHSTISHLDKAASDLRETLEKIN